MSSKHIYESELVSNLDALTCLKDRIASREESKRLHPRREVGWVAKRTMEYLKNTSAANQTKESVQNFIEEIKQVQKMEFTKAEILQLLNLNPQLEVTLFLILEECGERFSEDDRESLLEYCKLMTVSDSKEEK